MRTDREPEAGFSLLEVVVAIAVVALAAAAMINALEGAGRIQTAGADRALARIIAQNRMVETLARISPPATGETQGQDTALETTYDWRQTVSLAPGGDLLRVDVEVRLGESGQALVELTSFMAAP